MLVIGFFIDLGLLAMLLVGFDRYCKPESSLSRAAGLAMGMTFARLLFGLLIPKPYGIAILPLLVIFLYFMVHKVFGATQQAALKITGIFFLIKLCVRLIFSF